jgi:hypothetical protein
MIKDTSIRSTQDTPTSNTASISFKIRERESVDISISSITDWDLKCQWTLRKDTEFNHLRLTQTHRDLSVMYEDSSHRNYEQPAARGASMAGQLRRDLI